MQSFARAETVQVHRNELLMKTDWQLVIVDEGFGKLQALGAISRSLDAGHRLKNPETLLHTTMTKLRPSSSVWRFS